MPVHKSFKRAVRARAAKTGERYTAARAQILRKADPKSDTTPEGTLAPDAESPATPAPVELLVPDETTMRGTGRARDAWVTLLDAWGATERTHPEIARWLQSEQGVSGWWAQSITVGYERAHGMRAKHQMRSGFAVTASKTVGVPMERLRSAFADPGLRARWLPDAPMRLRPGRAASSARFSWADPASSVLVTFTAKAETKSTVSVLHERLPDAETAARLKTYWRERLGALNELLERS